MTEQAIRTFATGATRNSDKGKNDYEGFLSPLVLQAYGDFMTENRIMADGSLRDSDNWQKGIPRTQYMKSLLRHTIDLWIFWRGYPVRPDKRNGVEIPWTVDRLCGAVMFNIMGFLHETLKERIDTPVIAAWDMGRLPASTYEPPAHAIKKDVVKVMDDHHENFMPAQRMGQ
jgi:hypothetical protein